MECKECGYQNRENIKFCTRCGVSAGHLCSHCKALAYGGDIFCGQCGVFLENDIDNSACSGIIAEPPSPALFPVSDPRSPIESERKNVTVLFADVSGFTAMSEKLDPEEVTTIMNGCLTLMADIVCKYEGYVDKFIGDCIMAIFGAPITHENDPELALRAALEMTQKLEEFNKTLPIKLEKPLVLHVGINTGVVIAGNVGSENRMEYTVMGDTVNLASRLESSAARGQIFVSGYTYNLTRNLFDFKHLDPIKVKGKKDPVAVYELLAAKPASEVHARSKINFIPLVGRHQEVETLKNHTKRFIQGKGQAIFLVSDPGIGKSRILMEIKQQLKPESVEIIEGVCKSYGQTVSYAVFIDIFKGIFNIDTDDMTEAIGKKIMEGFPRSIGFDRDSMPKDGRLSIVFISRILGVDLAEDFDVNIAEMDPQHIKISTFRAITWFLNQLSQRKPLLIILENLHYSDSSSVELISFMLNELKQAPIMFLLLLRPHSEHASSKLSAVARHNFGNNYKEVVFHRLSATEGDEFVKHYMGTQNVPEGVLEFIRDRADGNPLYMEEIIRNLLNSQTIKCTESGKVELLNDLESIDIPDTIHGMILARIDKLEPDIKDVLQNAAVIGTSFGFDLLHRVVGLPVLELSLSYLVNAGLIFESRTFPEIEYSFCNVMIQEAVYATMLQKRLKKLHHNTAVQLEQLYMDRLMDYYEILAHHFCKTDNFEKAFEYLTKSGFKAKNLYANPEAVTYLIQAADLSEKMMPVPENLDSVLIALSEVFELLGRFPEAIEVWNRILELNNDPLRKADALRNVGRIREKSGFKEKALKDYEAAERLVEPFPEALETGLLFMNQSWVLNRLRQFDQAVIRAEKALEIFESLSAGEEIARVCNNLAVIHEHMGEFEQALSYNQRSLELFLETGNLRQAGNVNLSLGYLYNTTGELQAAMEYFDKSFEIMDRIGNRFGAVTALLSKGRCYVDLERMDEAELVLLQALRTHKDLNLSRKTVANEIALGNVYFKTDAVENAVRHLQHAREIAIEENFISDLGKVARLEAKILIKQSLDPLEKIQEAIDCFKNIGRQKTVDAICDEFSEFLT